MLRPSLLAERWSQHREKILEIHIYFQQLDGEGAYTLFRGRKRSSLLKSCPRGAEAFKNVDATNTPPGLRTRLISATCAMQIESELTSFWVPKPSHATVIASRWNDCSVNMRLESYSVLDQRCSAKMPLLYTEWKQCLSRKSVVAHP